MSILDIDIITNKEFLSIIEKMTNYKDSTLEAGIREYNIGYNTKCKEISLGVGYHNGVNNKFEIVIESTSYSLKVTYQQWKSFATMGRVLDRVTFPVPHKTNLCDLIPKNEDTLLKIIDEYRYTSEFEKRTFEELEELLK